MSGGTPTFDFYTSLSGNTIDSLLSSNDSVYVANNLPSNVYRVKAQDGAGCTSFVDVTVNTNSEILVDTQVVNASCYGYNDGSISLDVSGGTSPYAFSWSGPNSFVSSSEDILSLYSGLYNVVIKDSNDCAVELSDINVTEPAPISLVDTIIYSGTSATIDIIEPGCEGFSYTWSDESTDCKAENLVSGEYFVTITNDATGCSITANYLIDVDIPLIIPTLITPNNDGYNDIWKLSGIEAYDNIFIEIYNRWGNIIYTYDGSGYGYADKPFDGTYNGADLPIGAYVYILDLKNGKEPYHGVVNILRTKIK